MKVALQTADATRNSSPRAWRSDGLVGLALLLDAWSRTTSSPRGAPGGPVVTQSFREAM